MLQVEIKRADVYESKVSPSTAPGSRQFEPFMRRYQVGYVLLSLPNGEKDDVQTKIELDLRDGDFAKAPGFYSLDSSSFYVDKYRRLTLGRPVLVSEKHAMLKTA
jgi:hypothetical protein